MIDEGGLTALKSIHSVVLRIQREADVAADHAIRAKMLATDALAEIENMIEVQTKDKKGIDRFLRENQASGL